MYLHVRDYHLKIDWFLVCNIFFELYLLHFLQFALLETSSVDDDLANLKKELSGSSKVCLRQPLYHFLNDPSLAQKEDRKHFTGNNRSYTSAKGYNSPQKEIPILVNQEKWRKTPWFRIFMVCSVQLIQSVHPDSACRRKTTLYHPINVSSWQSRTSFFDFMNRKESFHLEGLLLAAQILHFHFEMRKLRRNWTSWGRGQKISEVLTTHCKYWLQIQNSSSKLNEFLFSLPIDLVKLRGQTDKTLYSWRPNSNN